MNVTIEKATCADAAELLQYFKEIGGETDNLSFGAEGLPFSIEAEEAYISRIENSSDAIMLIAKENGKIIGNAALSRLSGRMMHRGDVSVTVLKKHWNKGIGSRLLHEIINFARENSFKIIDLQVRSDNLAAIHLYEKLGFKRIGAHPAFFNIRGEDISVDYMCLILQ